jgi:hypothetical protein
VQCEERAPSRVLRLQELPVGRIGARREGARVSVARHARAQVPALPALTRLQQATLGVRAAAASTPQPACRRSRHAHQATSNA